MSDMRKRWRPKVRFDASLGMWHVSTPFVRPGERGFAAATHPDRTSAIAVLDVLLAAVGLELERTP